MQESLFPVIDHAYELIAAMRFMIQAAQILEIPIVVSEQSPLKLGMTIAPLKELFTPEQIINSKTTFSGMDDSEIKSQIENMACTQWILMGVEAHICILQTAQILMSVKKQVVVLHDAISSRSPYDFVTAVDEMRASNVRVSSSETVVYELLRDSKDEKFKELLPLIKQKGSSESCSTSCC
jgi:hypothetical protein